MSFPTVHYLDLQAILDRVHSHFIVNREPAGRIDGSPQCVFHGDQGEACAIGIFDDKHQLDDSVNEYGFSDLSVDRLEAVFGHYAQLLRNTFELIAKTMACRCVDIFENSRKTQCFFITSGRPRRVGALATMCR